MKPFAGFGVQSTKGCARFVTVAIITAVISRKLE